MTKKHLLTVLEKLNHNARMRYMVEVGRQAKQDASHARLLAQLESGNVYERMMALQACHGSRDSAQVMRALEDPSRIIRARARNIAPLICDDGQLVHALEMMPLRQRHYLLKLLRNRERQTAIDSYVTQLADRHDPYLGTALPFSSKLVASRYPVVPEEISLIELRRMAPAEAIAVLTQQAKTSRFDYRIRYIVDGLLAKLADACPAESLALLHKLARIIPLWSVNLQPLLRRLPNEIAELLLESDDQSISDFRPVIDRLRPELVIRLFQRGFLTLEKGWFRQLTPAQRGNLYRQASQAWQDNDGCITYDIVALLPGAMREEEGRRHLALPPLAVRNEIRLRYAALLPWDDACRELEPFIANPDADLRRVAIAAMIDNVRFHQTRLPELLTFLRMRKHEQDCVRSFMMWKLAALPPSRWQDEHLSDLGQLIRDALNAVDLSFSTTHHIERLIIQMVPFHPTWCAKWLATLVQERGQVSFFQLGAQLTDHDIEQIAPSLLPVFLAWETREREQHIIAAAVSLQHRLKVFDGLVNLLERIIQHSASDTLAAQALGVIATYRADRLHQLIPKLLRQDKSWIKCQTVNQYLHRCRQDLLTPYLGQTTYSGRFGSGRTRYILPFIDGFFRWTPRQQLIFAGVLAQVTQDDKRDTPALGATLQKLASLPNIHPILLMQLASLDNPRQVVRDLALQMLGRLDSGQGIPVLLQALHDQRARVAIYTLRPILLELPAENALALLRQIPQEKITIAKEVARLLGELPTEHAHEDLLAMAQRDLHRDVRVAVLRAFWNHLEDARTWPLLEAAARMADPAIASGVIRIPAFRLSMTAQRKLAALMALLLKHPDVNVRIATIGRCSSLPRRPTSVPLRRTNIGIRRYARRRRSELPPLDIIGRWSALPISDPDGEIARALLPALQSNVLDECRTGAAAIFNTYKPDEAPLIGEAITNIIAQRQKLTLVLDILRAFMYWQRERLLPIVHAVLDSLQPDPLTAVERVKLAVAALPWSELGTYLVQLAARDELTADVMASAIAAFQEHRRRSDIADITVVEMTLSQQDDAQLRRLALAVLVTAANSPSGWTEELIARLHEYRADPSPLVAAAAQFTFPPGELADAR